MKRTSASMKHSDIDQVWRELVDLVMETRGDWRRKVADVTGLPFSRARALWRLEDGARTLAQLAYDMGIDAPAATVMVNSLEERGLVNRTPHPEDRRAKLVVLTTAGHKLLAAIAKIPDAPPAGMSNLSTAEVTELGNILEKVLGRMQ